MKFDFPIEIYAEDGDDYIMLLRAPKMGYKQPTTILIADDELADVVMQLERILERKEKKR